MDGLGLSLSGITLLIDIVIGGAEKYTAELAIEASGGVN